MIETVVGVVFLGTIMLTLALRDFVDNSVLRDCARELKRIADATERSANLSDWRAWKQRKCLREIVKKIVVER